MSDGKIFYPSFYESLKRIEDDSVFRSAVESVMEYAFYGNEPKLDSLDPMAFIIYTMVKPTIDSNEIKKTNGSKGGRPKGENKKPVVSDKKTTGFEKDNLWMPKPKSTVTDTVTDTVTETVTDTDTETVTDTETETETETDMISAKADIRDIGISREEVQQLVDGWNSLPSPVPKIRKWVSGNSRDKSLKARIREYGIDNVKIAIENIKNSPFLLGQRTDFIISFDWFIGPKNFPKVLDGKYLDTKAERSGRSDTTDYLLQRIAEEEAKEKANDESRST